MAVPTGPVHAAANCVSNRGAPVCTAPITQSAGRIAPDLAGGYYVVWDDSRSDSPGSGIYVQHILPTGRADPAWPVDGLQVLATIQSGQGLGLAIVSDGAGGAIVAGTFWGGSDKDIFAQHVLSSATLDANWPTDGVVACDAAGNQYWTHMVADGAGGAFIAWEDLRNGGPLDIYAAHVLSTGVTDPGWPADGLAVCTAAEAQTLGGLVSDGLDGAYVVWNDLRSAMSLGHDVYAQHIAGGVGIAPGWAIDGQPVCVAPGDQYNATGATDGSGGLLVAWSNYDGIQTDVYAHRIEPSGTPDPAWPSCGRALTGNAADQVNPIALEDGSGGAFVVWKDLRTSADGDIYAQHVTGSGVLDGAWPADGRAICTASGVQYPISIVSDGSGGLITAWWDFRTSSADVFAHHVSAAGAVDPAWPADGRGIATASGDQFLDAAAGDGLGGAYLVWTDSPTSDLIGLRVEPDGTLDDPYEPNDACVAAPPAEPGSYPGLAVSFGDEDWFAVTLQRSERITADLTFLHANGDVDLRLWDACGGAILAASVSTTDDEHLTYTNTGPLTTVYVQVNLFGGGCNTYDMALTLDGTSNLNVTSTPPGWTGPLVARNAPGATPGNTQLTPALDGNLATTYLNWAIVNEGPNNLPSWDTEVWLDGETLLAYGVVGDDNPPGTSMVGNNGPHTVRGGRHTLQSFADRSDLVPETTEADNEYTATWLWSPLALQSRVPLTRVSPPGYYYGNDGFSFARDPNYAWIVAIASENTFADDYDLWVFDDYSGSTSGFSNAIGRSSGIAATDLVIGHYFGTPTILYPAAERWVHSADSDYHIVASDASGANGSLLSSDVQWLGEIMIDGEVARVYEAYMDAGQTCYFSLRRNTGTCDLAFRVFPGTPGGVYDINNLTTPIGWSTSQGEALDILTYTAAAAGWHPIAVFRIDGSDTGELDYDFHWNRNYLVEVAEERLNLAFLGITPNPVTGPGRLAFSLPSPGDVRLALLDLQGRVVTTLADGYFPAGNHSVQWNGLGPAGEPLRPGVYWTRFEAFGRIFTRRMVVLR